MLKPGSHSLSGMGCVDRELLILNKNLKVKLHPGVFTSLHIFLSVTEVFLRVHAVSAARRPGVLPSDNWRDTATYMCLVLRESFILISELGPNSVCLWL